MRVIISFGERLATFRLVNPAPRVKATKARRRSASCEDMLSRWGDFLCLAKKNDFSNLPRSYSNADKYLLLTYHVMQFVSFSVCVTPAKLGWRESQ